ncbi:unnamed protein product [Colias eurytheme]|nr:unnamed protein product [Colias eurytheme]
MKRLWFMSTQEPKSETMHRKCTHENKITTALFPSPEPETETYHSEFASENETATPRPESTKFYKFEKGIEEQEMQNTLKQMGEEVSDKFVITKVLMSLPEYKHFVSAWESAPDEKQTFENLVARLLIEE